MNFQAHLLFGDEGDHEEIVTTDTYTAVFYPLEYNFHFPTFRHKSFTGWDACWMGTIPQVKQTVHDWGAGQEVLEFLASITGRPGQLGFLWQTPPEHRCPVLYLNDEHMPMFEQVPTPGSHWVKTYKEFIAYVDDNIVDLTVVSLDYNLGAQETGEDALLYLEDKVSDALYTVPGYTPPEILINSWLGWGCQQLREPADRIHKLRERVLKARNSK